MLLWALDSSYRRVGSTLSDSGIGSSEAWDISEVGLVFSRLLQGDCWVLVTRVRFFFFGMINCQRVG